ncbi:MAG TPA: glycosyltransferase [Rhodanobacteraceae bacterium]|nr:glycosyltransferase [Rhodanobacteraceae bacterium]
MRLILDVQACQTESRKRGIGRYVASLTSAMLKLRGFDRDTLVALDGTYPKQADQVRADLRDRLPASNFTRYHYPPPMLPEGNPADPLRQVASQLIARHLGSLYPDAVLCGSMFEGYVEQVVTCENLIDIPGAVAAAVIYDLIPLVYADHYLDTASKKAWYFRKLSAVKNCDLLLAISEATRNDVIDRLGVPADRVMNIHAAADAIFRPLMPPRDAHLDQLQGWGITRKYVLYTGNGDFRKNIAGMLDAFARLPPEVRKRYQLVLNQVDAKRVRNEWLPRYGLTEDEVVVTGYVSDLELVILLNCCELFVFPSLYEGFGLPVLEAMACGAAVIGGDNSSIRELIKEPDARFDARDASAISQCMLRALTDQNFHSRLREQGRQRAGDFSWERSARQAVDAIEAAVQRKQSKCRVPVGPRPRLAMFTPLPPERTGIASYSADLLPCLAPHFVIDVYTTAAVVDDTEIAAGFSIRPWQQFETHAAEYNGIVYQIGNSPFHSHMFELLARYPGIVVLHDFFLSSVFWYMDRHGGHPGIFADELAYCHGAAALTDLVGPDGDNVCRQRYPCNRRVLERSVGVIAHSPGIRALLEKYGLGALNKPVRSVRQLRKHPPEVDGSTRAAIRERLGFRPNDWLVCSFGFVADTKLSDRLVRALMDARLSHEREVHLVFVGEMDGGTFGEELRRLICASGLADRIHITGFVNDRAYEEYLAVANVAVQLRSLSRGETSRAVLDCLAYGVPLIVNAHGTMMDYPDSILVRVGEQADTKELADALVRLHADPGVTSALSAEGRTYIAEMHSPARVAGDYASAITELLQRNAYLSPASFVSDIEPVAAACGDRSALVTAVGNALSKNLGAPTVPALVIDLSEVVHVDYGTGIHRVVRNLTRELVELSSDGSFRCIPAYLDQGEYRIASAYAGTLLATAYLAAHEAVEFAPGDTLLFLDSAWDAPERFLPVIRAAEDAGAEVIGFVYDLIPLRDSDACIPGMPVAFRRWLEHALRTSHAIVCISRATADDLVSYIDESQLPYRPGLRIDYVHLGSDLDGVVSGGPTDGAKAAFTGEHRLTFLTVGTLEPRKGYVEVLEAFDQLWADGCDVALCLVGKQGWKMEAFVQRMHAHPEFGQRLHWLRHISDVDLQYAYSHAAALIQASHAEGFGLPLLEAARYGTPVVCSDIPVFREVAGDEAYYFTMGSAAALKQRLHELVRNPTALSRRAKRERTWRDAAKDLLAVLGSHKAYRTLSDHSFDWKNPHIRDFSARVLLLSPPNMMRIGETVPTLVSLENTGSETWGACGEHLVRVSYYWTDETGDVVEAEGLRTNLTRDLEPGECASVLATLRSPNVAGNLCLVCTLVQEGVAWFDRHRSESCARHRVRIVD